MEFPWSSLVYFMTCKDHRFPVAEVPAQETATPRWAWRVLMMNPPNAEKMFRKRSLFAGVIRCYTLIHSYTVIPWISKKYINILYSKLKTSVSWLAVRRSSRFMLSIVAVFPGPTKIQSSFSRRPWTSHSCFSTRVARFFSASSVMTTWAEEAQIWKNGFVSKRLKGWFPHLIAKRRGYTVFSIFGCALRMESAGQPVWSCRVV